MDAPLLIEQQHPAVLPIERHASVTQNAWEMYVGKAELLPTDLRVLCALAGFFFARVVERYDGHVRLYVAALPHYLNPDDQPSRKRHVRCIEVADEGFAEMLPYDRRLAALATCDQREELELHVAAQRRAAFTATLVHVLALLLRYLPLEQRQVLFASPVEKQVSHAPTNTQDAVPTVAAALKPAMQKEQQKTPVSVQRSPRPTKRGVDQSSHPEPCLVVGPQVTVSRETLESIWKRTKQMHQEDNLSLARHRNALFLRAALATVTNRREKRLLRTILVERDRVRPHLSVEPDYRADGCPSTTGGEGLLHSVVACHIKVYVPAHLVA